MPPKRWHAPPEDPPGSVELAQALRITPVLASLLIARGIGDEREARAFLEPSLDQLHDPFLLPDIQPAVERVAKAIREGEKILVHGDYDVDGVCSASLLTRVFRKLNANVEAFVPHRRADGYDLQVESVRRAAASGVRLIVTADCGIVAFEAARTAAALGIDLIITDHHEPHPEGGLPEAVAVINPKRDDSEYPFQDLCGTGVAFKFSTALVQHLGVSSRKFQTAYLDLVALATCADCMPLLGENRALVRCGLDTLQKTNKAGLKALMDVAELTPEKVNARSLGFMIGPRINAIGRIDAAAHALNLLLTSDEAEAASLARKLDEANQERQQEQHRIFEEAIRQAQHYLEDRILVLASPKWHPGIIGIVASKITEALCRPAILVSLDEETGTGRGSCRSIAGFHIFEAINACRPLLVRCGGHQAAAGFDILPDNLDPFREAMREIGSAEIAEELMEPSVRVEAQIPVHQINGRLAREIQMLEPFGNGNPEPVFMTRDLGVMEQRRLASRAVNALDHLKLRVEHPAMRRGLEAVFWRGWSRAEECPPERRIDACYTLELNHHNGYVNLQLNLVDLRACEGPGDL